MLEGYIAHISAGRIRLKFPSAKGKEELFNFLVEKLQQSGIVLNTKSNIATGSIILLHEKSNDEIIEALEGLNIFKIKKSYDHFQENKIFDSINKNLNFYDKILLKISSGTLNLKSLIILFLIISATYQIARGNISSIPWYAALFYLNSLISTTKK